MPIKVGINGFGRIGRNILRASLGDPAIEFVAVNDITDPHTLAHLLKYDSILGNLTHRVTYTEDSIAVEGKSFRVFKVKELAELNWASVGAEIVVESTGLFTFFTGPRKCFRASEPLVKSPVDSTTISAPTEAQLISAGSLALKTRKLFPSTAMESSV